MWENTEKTFQAYVHPLTSALLLKCLGRILTALENDWPALVGNLRKAHKKWYWLSQILRREGDNPRVLGVFFVSVVKAVLLIGLYTWVMTPLMGRDMGGFQNRVSRRIT